MNAPFLPGLVPPEQAELPLHPALPATARQMDYAKRIATRAGKAVPEHLSRDRHALSAWIDAHKPAAPSGKFAKYPSAKQIAFAERLARLKHRAIPEECIRDRALLSRWIDGMKAG